MENQLFDVITDEDIPANTWWCKICERFETNVLHNSDIHVDPEMAPVPYSTWLRMVSKYHDARYAYRKWVKDGKPAI